MSIYTRSDATVIRLLTKYGQTVTLKRSSGLTLDPIIGATGTETVTEIETKGIVQEYSNKELEQSAIQSSDRKITLTSTQEPLLTDVISVGGKDFKPIRIETMNPAGVILAYKIQARI